MVSASTLELPPISEQEFFWQLDELGLLSDMVGQAVERAREAHGDQIRDNGESYLEQHVLPIALGAGRYFSTQEDAEPHAAEKATTIGLLHDVVEDSEYTVAQCTEDFGPEIGEAVDQLSKDPNGKSNYIPRLHRASDMVRTLKLIDRCNNLESSLRMWPDGRKKLSGYVLETTGLYVPLAATLRDGAWGGRLTTLVETAEDLLSEPLALPNFPRQANAATRR